MEIKINDYVRTKDGLIFKIIGGNEDNWNLDIDYSILEYYEENWLELFKYNDNYSFFTNENIIKSSPQIIDLIRAGDYVNGLKVSNVNGTYHGRKDKAIYCDYCENKETGKWVMIYDDEIKSILTKEMFEQMEYKIN